MEAGLGKFFVRPYPAPCPQIEKRRMGEEEEKEEEEEEEANDE